MSVSVVFSGHVTSHALHENVACCYRWIGVVFCRFVCLLVTNVNPAKMSELIMMLLECELVGPKEYF